MNKEKKWAQGASAITRLFRKKLQHPTLAGTGESSPEVHPAQPNPGVSSKHEPASNQSEQAPTVASSGLSQVAPVSNSSKPVRSVEKTFRVQGIALGITGEETEQLVQDLLGCLKDDTGLQCRSVATHHSGRSQDATISFNKSCPPCLQTKLPYSNDHRAEDESPTLIFDESFLGLTTLSSCPEDKHQVNVIALSGIGAHAFRSFKNRDKSHMWLRDDLPKDLPGSHIMIWGYESTIPKSEDTKSIQDISRQLRHDLSQISKSVRSRPFIFVAHSLGGLVLKKLLIDLCNSAKGSNNDSEASALINLIRGVIFCGVPHFGLETQVINTLVQMAENQPNEPLLHSIGQDSELLDQMHKQYAQLFSKTRFPRSTACCVYETKLSPTAVYTDGEWAMIGPPALFVNKQSATAPRHGGESTDLSLPIDETHSNLVKFPPRSQHYYRIVQIMKDSLATQTPPIYEHTLEERECLRMLYPGDYKRYKDRNPEPVDGTCRWVLDHQLYTEWLRMNQSTLLWISADPGCGKSVLAKALIDRDLVNSDNAPLLYFFFKDDDTDQMSAAKAMAALLHQLFSKPQWAFLIRYAMPDYRNMGQGLVNSFANLWEVFLLAVSDPRVGPIYCVLDALDECVQKDRSELLSALECAFNKPENSELRGNVKVLVTSRPYQDIERRFFFLIRLEGERETKIIKKEIDRVIKHKVPELSQRLRLDQRQQSLLQAKLLSVEHRTYLWLHLVLENLIQSNNLNRKKFDKIIDDLPRSVEAAYEKILSKGDKTEQHKLMDLLQLVVAATRPLSVTELNIALPLGLHDPRSHQTFVDEELEPDDQFKTTIRNWCGLFLTVVDNLVYLLHQTAREFLITKQSDNVNASTGWKNSIQLWKAEILMTHKCVAYLMFNDLNDSSTFFEPRQLQVRFGFFEYAARSWYHHFREIQTLWNHEGADDLFSAVYKLYDVESRRFQNWSSICNDPPASGQPTISISQPLMVVTDVGHHVSIRAFSQAGWDLEITDGHNKHTPFLRAVSRRDWATSKTLVELGVNIEARDRNGETALTILAKDKKRRDMFQWLVDVGANLEAKDLNGKTSLQHALETNSEEAIKSLLKAGADKESKDEESRTILSRLAGSNSSQAVRLLLSYGADCDSKDRFGKSPLMWAAGCGSDATDVMELLISYGSDVNKRDVLGRTPLHWVVTSSGDLSLANFKVLLGHNAQVNIMDSSGSTPLGMTLQTPVLMNRLDIVRLLLAWKADINAKERFGRTALCSVLRCTAFSEAQDQATEEIIRELLSSGAEIDTTDDEGRTPLFWALEGGLACVKLAEMLVGSGANRGSRVLQGHPIEYWAERKSSPAAEIDGVESIAEEIARIRAENESTTAPLDISPQSNPFGATKQWQIS